MLGSAEAQDGEVDGWQDKLRVQQEGLFMPCWEQSWFRFDPEDQTATKGSRSDHDQIFNFKDYVFFKHLCAQIQSHSNINSQSIPLSNSPPR